MLARRRHPAGDFRRQGQQFRARRAVAFGPCLCYLFGADELAAKFGDLELRFVGLRRGEALALGLQCVALVPLGQPPRELGEREARIDRARGVAVADEPV